MYVLPVVVLPAAYGDWEVIHFAWKINEADCADDIFDFVGFFVARM